MRRDRGRNGIGDGTAGAAGAPGESTHIARGEVSADSPLTYLAPPPMPSGAAKSRAFTLHIGSAGRITLASRDNAAAGAHRPATLRVGARGSVVMISAAALRQPPPIAPE